MTETSAQEADARTSERAARGAQAGRRRLRARSRRPRRRQDHRPRGRPVRPAQRPSPPARAMAAATTGATTATTATEQGSAKAAAAGKAAEKLASGESPDQGRLLRRRNRHQGEGQGPLRAGRQGWQGRRPQVQVQQLRRQLRRRRPGPGRVQPVDHLRPVARLHEEDRARRARRGPGQGQAQGAGVLVPPRVGDHDQGTGPRQADRLGLRRAEGAHQRRGHLPFPGRGPHADRRRPRVLPAGVLREDGQHVAGGQPSDAPGDQVLRPPGHARRDPAPRGLRGLPRRDPRQGDRAQSRGRGGGGAAGRGGAAEGEQPEEGGEEEQQPEGEEPEGAAEGEAEEEGEEEEEEPEPAEAQGRTQ